MKRKLQLKTKVRLIELCKLLMFYAMFNVFLILITAISQMLKVFVVDDWTVIATSAACIFTFICLPLSVAIVMDEEYINESISDYNKKNKIKF